MERSWGMRVSHVCCTSLQWPFLFPRARCSPAGTFSGIGGRSTCLACPAGSYQDATGQQECQASCRCEGRLRSTLDAPLAAPLHFSELSSLSPFPPPMPHPCRPAPAARTPPLPARAPAWPATTAGPWWLRALAAWTRTTCLTSCPQLVSWLGGAARGCLRQLLKRSCCLPSAVAPNHSAIAPHHRPTTPIPLTVCRLPGCQDLRLQLPV